MSELLADHAYSGCVHKRGDLLDLHRHKTVNYAFSFTQSLEYSNLHCPPEDDGREFRFCCADLATTNS